MKAPAARTGTRPLLVLAWLAATVLGGVVAWSAVTVVAGERGDGGPGVLSQAQVAADLAAATAADGLTPAPGATGDGPAPSATPSPGTAAPPPSDPAAAPPAAEPPGSSPPTAPPAAVPPVPPAPSAQDVARTWTVGGGEVGAVCTGPAIRLLYATPADGWTVEVDSAGPQEVEVDFTRDGAGSRVRAECVGGTPELGDGTGGGDDDDGGDDRSGRGGGDDD